jgi:hypothetical protein
MTPTGNWFGQLGDAKMEGESGDSMMGGSDPDFLVGR